MVYVSQIYADAAMVGAGQTKHLAYMNNTFKFMENMWDKKDLRGGYFASVNLDGSGAGGDKYVDDNALSGWSIWKLTTSPPEPINKPIWLKQKLAVIS